jgi:S1-C subfamily serine protease
MVPYSVARYDVGAVFFAKIKHRLGVIVVPLTDAERQQLGTNSALRVSVVVDGTPAFFADVLPGDYVLEFAGKLPSSAAVFPELVKEHEGQTVEISLQRGDKRITKSVSINRY